MSLLKRLFVFSLVVTTVLTISLPGWTVKAAGNYGAGSLLAKQGVKGAAVYYVGSDGKKYVFPDVKTYMTWYSDFKDVVRVTVAELDMYMDGGAVTYRAGTKLVKTEDTAKVYALSNGGVLHLIPSEAVAKTLYGNNWAKMVQDVIPGFFSSSYKFTGTDLSTMYPNGTVVSMGSNRYLIADGKKRPFASADAFDANNLMAANVIAVTDLSAYPDGTSITGEEVAVSGFMPAAGGAATGPAGSVSVSLASDTPASGIVVGGASRVPFTKVNFVNNSATDVVVDQVLVKRTGLAADGNFSGIDLLKASDMTTLNNQSKTLSSEHVATFNDDWTIPANTTMGVFITGTMVASLAATAGEVPILALWAVTLKGNATLSGSLPISGNYQTTNGTITIGTATVAAGGQNPAASTKEVGTMDYIVSSYKITANSAEDILVKSLTLTNNGTTANTDMKNVKLVDANTNATLATVATVPGKKMTFSALNYTLGKGKNVTFDLRLDAEGGSARTISWDIDQTGDLVVEGKTYGYNIAPTYPNTASPYFNSNDTTIGNGTLRVESISVTPTTNVSEGLNQVTLGKFKFVVKGETMNVTAVGWNFTVTTSVAGTGFADITNITVYNSAGAVVAGPKDLTSLVDIDAGGWKATATTTDTMTIPVGENTYTLKADLNTDFTANDTIIVGVEAGAMTNKGDVTANSITPTPTGTNTQSSTMTVKAATLAISVANTPAAQTVVPGNNGFVLARYILDASASGTDVTVNSIAPTYKTTVNAFPNMLSGWTLWDGSTPIAISSESTTCSGASCSTVATNATTTLSLATKALVVTAGTSRTITAKANVGTGATSGTIVVGLNTNANVSVVDSQGQSFTSTVTNGDGQAMTLTTGATLEVSVSSDPAAKGYVGGTTAEIGRMTMYSRFDGVNFNFLGFTIADASVGMNGTFSDLTTLSLWDGTTNLGQVNVTGANATITPPTGTSLSLDQSKVYTVKATFASINTTSVATSGDTFNVTLTNADVTGQSAGSTSVTKVGVGTAFSNNTVWKSVPTVTKIDFTNSALTDGVQNLFKFSVAADPAGPVGLFKFTFGVTTTTVTLASGGYYLYDSSSSGTLGDLLASAGDITRTETDANATDVIEVSLDNANDNANAPAQEHRIIQAGETRYFTLAGTVSGHTGSSTDSESISTVLAGDEVFGASAALKKRASQATGIDGLADGEDFIWSDLNFTQNSTITATRTLGWFNGFKVTGLDNASTTAQAITG